MKIHKFTLRDGKIYPLCMRHKWNFRGHGIVIGEFYIENVTCKRCIKNHKAIKEISNVMRQIIPQISGAIVNEIRRR